MHPFVHLHLHTEYSLVDGTVRIPALMAQCAKLGQPAVALTDQGNLFGLVKFYQKALAHGIKPIIGVDLKIADPADPTRTDALVLLCQNRDGYRNLSRLITRSYLEGQQRGVPMVRREWLQRADCAGLIALSGAGGDVGQALVKGHHDTADEHLRHWQKVFDGG